MSKIYLAEKSQLDTINAKITPKDLATVNVYVCDFVEDDVTITSGGLDSVNRRITT